MRKKKALWGMLLAAAVLIIGCYAFFDSIIDGEWNDKRQAVERAYRETMLVKADKVESFVGSQPYMIVYGEDKVGSRMIVWVSETDLFSAYETEGVPKQAVMDKTAAADARNRIIRATPGKLDNNYAWEVYYQRDQDGAAYYFYDYYRFSDGTLLDTYRLGAQ